MDGRGLVELARVTCRGDFIARVARGFLVVDGSTGEALAIHKAFGHPDRDRVSVGCTRNCDVTLRDVSVSKLHAHFDLTREALQLLDARSHHGTRINGRTLVPHTPAVVVSGDIVVFGRVFCRFLDAADLYDRLR